MDADYPGELLSREPGLAVPGRGRVRALALQRGSVAGQSSGRDRRARRAPPLVWAVDTRHAPMFWFPRDCPRGCVWAVSMTTAADRERFFGQSDREPHPRHRGRLAPDRVQAPACCMPTGCQRGQFRPARGGRVLGPPTSGWTRSSGWSWTTCSGGTPRAGIEVRITPVDLAVLAPGGGRRRWSSAARGCAMRRRTRCRPPGSSGRMTSVHGGISASDRSAVPLSPASSAESFCSRSRMLE